MGFDLWHAARNTRLRERLELWWNQADVQDRVLTVGLSHEELRLLSERFGADALWAFRDQSETVALWMPRAAVEFQERQKNEHQQLLLILQEALIKIAETNPDLASKLAARAYVNLKTDPKGQRRYDGLLHRFTGVLHRRPKEQNESGPNRDN